MKPKLKKTLFSLLAIAMIAGMMPVMALSAHATNATTAIVMSEQGFENGASLEDQEITKDDVTIVASKADGGTAPAYYNTGNSLLVYANNTLTVSVADGNEISGIEFTFGSEDGTNEINADKGTFSANTWTGSAQSVTFTIGGTSGHRKIASLAVTYEETAPATVALTGVTLNKESATLTVDGSETLTLDVSLEDATDKTVIWSIGGTNAEAITLNSDEACENQVALDTATETLTVYVKGVSAGSATITVTSNEDSTKAASCEVTVNASLAPVPYMAWSESEQAVENAEGGCAEYEVVTADTADPASYFSSDDAQYIVIRTAEGEANLSFPYRVFYHANGGTDGEVVDASDYSPGTNAIAMANGFTAPTGKQFAEWNTAPDGTGDAYDPGDEIPIANSDVNLYAIWENLPAIPPTIDGINGVTLTYGYASGSICVTATVAEGHTLSYQWYELPAAAGNSVGGMLASAGTMDVIGTPITGATSETYNLPLGKNVGEYDYYCVVTATRQDNGLTASATSDTVTATVNPKTVTVTAADKTKIYGEEDPTLIYTVEGLVGTDALTGKLSREAGENVGEYEITQGTLSAGENYELTFTGAKLTITKKTLRIIAKAQSKTYGETDPELTYIAEGLVPGDTFTGELTRIAGEHVGQYDINIGTLTVGDNYSVVYYGAKLTIQQKTLFVNADAKTKVYGSEDPALTYAVTGLVGSDKLTGELRRTAGESVGAYAISLGTLSASDDYRIFYHSESLRITPKALKVTADAKTKEYGSADPVLTYTYEGLVAGDSFIGALTRKKGESLGKYEISRGTLSAGENYELTFVGAEFSIVKASQEAPAISRTDETVKGKNDGTITRLTGDMEYRTEGGTYAPITDSVLENLAPGTYYVRYAGDQNHEPSTDTTVEIQVGKTLTVQFNTMGGNEIAPLTNLSWQAEISAPEEPKLDGYTFKGWYSEESLQTLYDFASEKVTEDITLYAKWEENDPTGVSDWLITDEHTAFLSGYADGTIRPMNNITRAEVAMIFYRLLKDKNVSGNASFPDVKDSSWYATAVKTLANLGIITGYPDGTFKPSKTITRAEFCAMAVRFAVSTGRITSYFSDVKEGYWAAPYISTAAEYGWVNGYSDGTFKPGENIERYAVATIVNRMLGRAADQEYVEKNREEFTKFSDLNNPDAWYYYAVIEASYEHEYTVEDGTEKWVRKAD